MEETKQTAPVPEEKQNEEPQKGISAKPRQALLRYMAVLFAAAFLLVLFSFLIQMRNNRLTINELTTSSNNAMTNALALQTANQTLTEENAALSAQVASLTAQAAELEAQLADAQADAADAQAARDALAESEGKREAAETSLAVALTAQQDAEDAAALLSGQVAALEDELAASGARNEALERQLAVAAALAEGFEAAQNEDLAAVADRLAQVDAQGGAAEGAQRTLYRYLQGLLTAE